MINVPQQTSDTVSPGEQRQAENCIADAEYNSSSLRTHTHTHRQAYVQYGTDAVQAGGHS